MKKKLLIIIAGLLIIAGGCVAFGYHNDNVKHIGFSTDPTFDSIAIKWKQQHNVQYYDIYRLDITDTVDKAIYPPLEEYEVIASVDGDSHSYKDSDVQSGHVYAYEITGFRKGFFHPKQVCTSYIEDSNTYEMSGLMKPALLNNGDGENYENSKDKIYLYMEYYGGMEPEGVELYRKGTGDANFKKIDFKGLDSRQEMLDDTVIPGETYTYKIRTTLHYHGEKKYSPYSDEITIPAVNFVAHYDVKVIDRTKRTFAIQVTSGAFNGVTTFDSQFWAKYTVQKDKQNKANVFSAYLIGYQKQEDGDGQWQDIPKKGVRIKAGESILLKYKLTAFEGYDENADPDTEVFFGGSDAVISELFMDQTESGGATYQGSGNGTTIMTLNLVSGKGKAYCDYDY